MDIEDIAEDIATIDNYFKEKKEIDDKYKSHLIFHLILQVPTPILI